MSLCIEVKGGYVSHFRQRMEHAARCHLVVVTHFILLAGGIMFGWEKVQPIRVQFDPYLQACKKTRASFH